MAQKAWDRESYSTKEEGKLRAKTSNCKVAAVLFLSIPRLLMFLVIKKYSIIKLLLNHEVRAMKKLISLLLLLTLAISAYAEIAITYDDFVIKIETDGAICAGDKEYNIDSVYAEEILLKLKEYESKLGKFCEKPEGKGIIELDFENKSFFICYDLIKDIPYEDYIVSDISSAESMFKQALLDISYILARAGYKYDLKSFALSE